jgi:hypothetical protein
MKPGESENTEATTDHHDESSASAPLSRSLESSFDSASLNELDEELANRDIQGIALLKQIFPEESIEQLRRLHEGRVRRTPEEYPLWRHGTPRSRLGNRIRRRLPDAVNWREQYLPHDFLRLPPVVAVRRYSNNDGLWHYELVSELEARALEHLRCLRPTSSDTQDEFYTKVIFRGEVGFGMNLVEESGHIRVHSLNQGDSGGTTFKEGPASRAGILSGDVLVGINGKALMESVSPGEGMLMHVGSSLRQSPDPVVLHLLRSGSLDRREHICEPPTIITTQSLLDTSDFLEEVPSVEVSFESEPAFPSTPFLTGSWEINPFVATLVSRNLVKRGKDDRSTSQMLNQFTERARQWEATSSFTILSNGQNFGATFVPLMGLRKALSVRIVNSFTDGEETAYTTWVYDVESGREWYAPVRYFKDFQDLRAATLPLLPCVSQLPFPKAVLSIFGSPVRKESSSEKENKCRQLESFLRSLSVVIYREALHPSMAEIAIHVQSFLGCDAVLGSFGSLCEAMGEMADNVNISYERQVRLGLKRSIQRYVYRLFLLSPLCSTVDNFISSMRAQAPRLQDIESLEAEGRSALKCRAVKELSKVQTFLDQLQEMILHGCREDFRSIAERDEYEAIHRRILGSANGDVYWDRLMREAVREQIEIEVYVPLRSIVSKWLVSGWKHEGKVTAGF